MARDGHTHEEGEERIYDHTRAFLADVKEIHCRLLPS